MLPFLSSNLTIFGWSSQLSSLLKHSQQLAPLIIIHTMPASDLINMPKTTHTHVILVQTT